MVGRGNPQPDRWLGVGGSGLKILLLTNEVHVSAPEGSQEAGASARCRPEILLAGTTAALDGEERILESATFTSF